MEKTCGYKIESESLGGLLTSAKKLLQTKGVKTVSQRGATYSLNRVLLTWTKPSLKKDRYVFRSLKEDEWYQNIFVRKLSKNIPERLASSGEYLFPYKYAQRGRFYDSGWGYTFGVVRAIERVGGSLDTHLKNIKNFESWLVDLGKYIHLQTVLTTFTKWGSKKMLKFWAKNISLLETIKDSSRIDPLEKIIKEVKNTSETRRAITPSFMYGGDYLLNPMMGVPPYQNFQLLPGKENDKLSSLHWHRSLDASGGAQLDFNHDFDWLSEASVKTGRKMGGISVITGNLHLYSSEETDNVKDWLYRVTDGYASDSNTLMELSKKDVYAKNIRRVFNALKR